jgi:alkanesulfonate monooxygenase SsuD/methylene tetrahydromethanopterin reductase-like flavin-dependent oxidoreductase (luciferase family)
MSSLHRNPGITAKAAATIDEISGGRFVLGLGAGHAGSGAHAFGMPEDHVYDRFEEAIDIVVPLLRAGRADLDGIYHVARDLEQLPPGPRPTGIPILLAAHGAKGYRHAARVADIWSCYAEEGSDVAELGPRVTDFEAACAMVDRDPSTIGRSAGVTVAPLQGEGATGIFGKMIAGSAEQIADAFRSFRAAGFTGLQTVSKPIASARMARSRISTHGTVVPSVADRHEPRTTPISNARMLTCQSAGCRLRRSSLGGPAAADAASSPTWRGGRSWLDWRPPERE